MGGSARRHVGGVGDSVEGNHDWTPPDKPVNAQSGVMFPVALRPDLTVVPATNRDGGRGTAYTLRCSDEL